MIRPFAAHRPEPVTIDLDGRTCMRRSDLQRIGILVCCLMFGLCTPAFVSADQNTVDLVLPQIGQRGTTVTVRMQGAHLESAEEVLFYRPGIRCTGIRRLDSIPHQQNGRPIPAKPGRAIELDFEISANAQLGEYYLRLRTRRKLSELLSFWVTPFPVVHEKHAYADRDGYRNDQPEFAQRVPLNCTVVGYQSSNERANDWDLYRVQLKKGQRLTAQILSARLGTIHYGGLTDMAIEVKSPSGKRVARSDRSALFTHDPVVSFFAPESGDYLITVRQQMDTEAFQLHYGLHLGEFARPTVTFPLGGQAGKPIQLDVFHLDGTHKKLTAVLPESVKPFERSMIELTSVAPLGVLPSPNRIQVAAFPNVFENEAAASQAGQQVRQSLPFALNGKITSEGEKDAFRFVAQKGKRYRVRAYARTLGSPLDPLITIRPADGNPSRQKYREDDSLWDGHDWEGHHYRHQVKDRLDPIFMFEPDHDGEYILSVMDTRREFGADYVYRVELQPHRDSLFTYYKDYPSQPTTVRDVIAIHRGSSVNHPLAIQNGFGSQYDGKIRLEARGLPANITFECPEFTRNDSVILATFHAPANAEIQAGLFELIPHAVEQGVSLTGAFAQTSNANDQRGGYAPLFNKTRKAAFAVLEEAPFDVRIEQPKIGLARNAELDLRVHVERRNGFEGPLYLEMDWLPEGVTKQPPLVIKAGEVTGNYRLSATERAQAGTYRVALTAREYEGGNPRSGVGFRYIASPLVDIRVTTPYLKVDLQRAAIVQGKRGELIGKVTHLRPFKGEAIAKLVRLPTGVTLENAATIRPGDKIVRFPIRVAPDALAGQHKDIGCNIAITESGQQIQQYSGSGVLRIDPKK